MPIGMARSRRLRLVLAALAGAVALGAAVSPAAAARCANATEVPSVADVAAARATVLCLVNRERTARGLRALRANRLLDRAAARHSADMVRHGYFDHTSPAGSTLTSRVTASGYLGHTRAWMAGENIAWGDGPLGTPAAIVDAWMHSPGHRANILRRQFREVGTGVVAGVPVDDAGLAGATYTQDFGTRG